MENHEINWLMYQLNVMLCLYVISVFLEITPYLSIILCMCVCLCLCKCMCLGQRQRCRGDETGRVHFPWAMLS